jgi:hypothetical protein
MKTVVYKAHEIVASAEFQPNSSAWTRRARVTRVGRRDPGLYMTEVDGGFKNEEEAEEGALQMAKDWVDRLVPDH